MPGWCSASRAASDLPPRVSARRIARRIADRERSQHLRMTRAARRDRAVVEVRPFVIERYRSLEHRRVRRHSYVDDDVVIGTDEPETVRGVVTAETEGDRVAWLQRARTDGGRNRDRGGAGGDVEHAAGDRRRHDRDAGILRGGDVSGIRGAVVDDGAVHEDGLV